MTRPAALKQGGISPLGTVDPDDEDSSVMTLAVVGLVVALIAFGYLTKAPSPGGAVPGCAGIALGLLIAAWAIAKLIFF